MKTFNKYFLEKAEEIKKSGLWKTERALSGAQGSVIKCGAKELINMCANNYLGLSNNPEIVEAAREAALNWGYGMSSVRFICGAQELHLRLEKAISEFLETEDAILYSSCYDANGGLFETLFDENDAIISDQLNHASIIDGVRLCKARRLRYANNNMEELEKCLQTAADSRIRAIVTDGVFSMDGSIANLPDICDLANKYDALVIVDDSHGVGVIGEGRGTPKYCGRAVDIITGTLGKALGGASGGYTTGNKTIINILRQRSRTYLFSNSLAPFICGASLKAIELAKKGSLIKKLEQNTLYFRTELSKLGFDLLLGVHPIIPVMFYDELDAKKAAETLYENGVYAVGFFYPVVPKGKARIRLQVSAAHTKEHLDKAILAFKALKNER